MGLSSRVGVRKCGLAVLVAGLLVLLAGCSDPKPTLVQVRCKDYPKGGAVIDNKLYYAFEIWYWSDGTRITRALEYTC